MHQEIKATVIWLALAFFLTFAGFWQAKVAIDRDFQARHRGLPAPAKTKHSIRPPPTAFTGDVVEDYIARCEKGMTDQEIGWILEDFHDAGLDADPFSEFGFVPIATALAYNSAQARWFHDALVNGLRLSTAQSSDAARKLAELLSATHARYIKFIESGQKSDGSESLSFYSAWLAPADSEPGNFPGLPRDLCTLTTQQLEITDPLYYWKEKPAPLPYRLQGKIMIRGSPGEPSPIPAEFETALICLSFLQSQQFTIAADPFGYNPDLVLGNVRHLHPAQLKIILMFQPGLTEEIQMALDNAARSAR